MRTLERLSAHGTQRLLWLVLPFFLLLFAQAFSGPLPDFSKNTASETASNFNAGAPGQTSNLAVTVSAGSNAPLCAGSTLNLNATIIAGTAPFTFSWDGPAGFTSAAQNPSRPNTVTAHAGVYTVTVTDDTGMTGSATVTVDISVAPTANAGPDVTLCKGTPHQLNGTLGGSATSATWTASVGGGNFTPNPSMLNAVYHPPANYVGNITLTLTTNAPSPCAAATDQLVITYGQPDAMFCNDLVLVSMDDDCSVTVTPDMALEGDVLDSLYSVNIYTLQGVNIGNTITSQYVGIPLKIKVTDNCSGNFCITDVKVEDVLPPVFINCESFTVPCVVNEYSPQYLYNTLGIQAAYPQVTDNCSAYTLTKVDTWVDVLCGGIFHGKNNLSGYVRREWTATDASKNKSTCTQYIYFERVSIYDLALPTDATVSCDVIATDPMATGAPTYTGFDQIPFPIVGSSMFCEISATYTDQILPLCGGTYSIVRTWTIFNLCAPSSPTPPQNPLTHIQLINVIDQQGPAIACPGNLTVSTDPLDCCATVDLPDVIVQDACSKVQDMTAFIYVINPVTGDTIDEIIVPGTLSNFPGNNLGNSDTLAVFGNTPCLPLGKHIVRYYSEDVCGNFASCTFTLTVTDNVPPVAACDEITQVSLGIDGMIFVNASTFDDGSYDNCGQVYFKARRQDANGCQPNNRFYDQVKFCCEDVGDTITVIFRVYDVQVPPGEVSLTLEEQHSNDCQVQVYVDDKLKPACVPPNNVTVSCENFDPSLWAYGMPTAADNCCVDTITGSDSYAQFDTVCSKGTITRTFRVFDCHGQSNQCIQRIFVDYKQHYYVKFPDDVIITACAGVDDFGAPQFYGEDCELLGVSYQDQLFTVVPDACYKLERTWTIINWCTYDPNMGCTFVPNPNPSNTLNHATNLAGPIVSPFGTPAPWAPTVTKITPSDNDVTNYSKYWTANVNCYQYKQIIKITDTQKPTIQCPASPAEVCDLTYNDATLWKAPYWYDSKLQIHDLCEAPTDLCITASDACSGANINIRYLLFLDLDGNGTMETVVNSLNPPAAGTVSYNNAGNPNYGGGLVRVFDSRNVPLDQKYQFTIQTTEAGFSKTACLRWNTQAQPGNFALPELPYGTHKIKWIVSDGCGNEEVCEYAFVVKDCKAPTLKCYNGLSTNMMPTGMVVSNYQLFLEDAEDNCTPKGMLIFGIRKAGTGNGFPFNPDGTPQTSVTFDCTELGFQLVELWGMDMAGNADYCTTFMHVQDNIGVCNSNAATVAGMLQTEMGDGLEEANVQIQCLAPTGQAPLSLFDMTDTDGHYQFNNAIPIQCNYTLTPLKDNDPINGVSTFDLVLINKHILGLQPFASPYKIIAADANNSGSVTTFDIVELRKLILGIYNELPNNTSWRFVDKTYQFPNPANPFQEAFPETKSVSNLQNNQMADDFVAVKIGDVNANNVPNGLLASEDRNAGTLLFDVATSGNKREVKAGEIFTVDFTAAEKVLAYQLTMNFPDLEIINIEPGEGMREDHFAIFADDHALTTSFEVPGNIEQTQFRISFRARTAGLLDKMLAVSSRITKAEAYRHNDETANDEVSKLDVAFRFNHDGVFTISTVGFELYQNTPNPWIHKTQVGFHLPQAAGATLTVYDEMGRALFSETADFNQGYNAILIEHALLDAPGVMYYTLETPFGKATRKMVQSQ